MTLSCYAIVGTKPARELRGLEFLAVAGAWVAVKHAPVPDVSVKAAVAHDRVVRAVAKVCDAVLPLRFGMGAESKSALAKKLAPFRAAIREALAHVRGAVQMTMRVGGREMKEEARVRVALETHVRGERGPGTRFLARKVAAERVPEIDPLSDALAPYVRDTRIQRLPHGAHFASVYFLVAKERLAAWRRVVRGTTIPHVTWQVTGPWPPYAFAELR